MVFQYLGTAAAEAWPALFCNCPQCKKARENGGRDIRTRSQSILDNHILIDFPCDTYKHVLDAQIDLSAVDLLLITHPHTDHLYPGDLLLRRPPYGHDPAVPVLHVAAGQGALRKIGEYLKYDYNQTLANIELHALTAYKPAELCGVKIVPIPAYHMLNVDADPFCYAIETKGKRILYLHDTGEKIAEALEPLRGEKPFDFISFDCCYGTRVCGYANGHMGLSNNVRLRGTLFGMGLCRPDTICCVNHFSHNIPDMYADMVEAASLYDMLSSYDGMKIEL